MTYHLDRFLAAVSALSGNGHIKQRLISAFEDNLADLDEDELPVLLHESFAELRNMMQRVAPINGESHIRASVRKMSLNDAQDCAHLMVSMYARVAEHASREGHPKLAAVPAVEKVPTFLAKS